MRRIELEQILLSIHGERERGEREERGEEGGRERVGGREGREEGGRE